MPQDIAFNEPVIVQISSQPIRTVDQSCGRIYANSSRCSD